MDGQHGPARAFLANVAFSLPLRTNVAECLPGVWCSTSCAHQPGVYRGEGAALLQYSNPLSAEESAEAGPRHGNLCNNGRRPERLRDHVRTRSPVYETYRRSASADQEMRLECSLHRNRIRVSLAQRWPGSVELPAFQLASCVGSRRLRSGHGLYAGTTERSRGSLDASNAVHHREDLQFPSYHPSVPRSQASRRAGAHAAPARGVVTAEKHDGRME